jgi:hypothetical protein
MRILGALSRAALAVVGLSAVLGCGRVGFDPLSTAGSDGGFDAGPPPPLVTDPDLVAYWPFDEAAGATSFIDLSGNANTGSCTKCPTSGVPGVRGAAVMFKNAADSLGVGTGPSLSSLNQALTVSAWVKLNSYTNYGYIVSNDRDCSGCGNYAGYGLRATYYGGAETFEVRDGTSVEKLVTTSTQMPLAQWHFVVGTFASGTMLLYVDAQLVKMSGGATLAAPPTLETRIGAMGFGPQTSYGLDGTVDEVMIFRRALTASEITTLYDYYAALIGP